CCFIRRAASTTVVVFAAPIGVCSATMERIDRIDMTVSTEGGSIEPPQQKQSQVGSETTFIAFHTPGAPDTKVVSDPTLVRRLFAGADAPSNAIPLRLSPGPGPADPCVAGGESGQTSSANRFRRYWCNGKSCRVLISRRISHSLTIRAAPRPLRQSMQNACRVRKDQNNPALA